ncbi:MAG: lipoprotein-releasing ABC transporter permease subunit [Gammaproteobacteria bacterium]|jgi:lipoprotein-releasing system permease protein
MIQPYQLAIALRYLRTRSANSFISFISLVSMLGIALAVAVLIVVLSVTNGFYYELQQRTLGMISDATISGFGGTLDDWRVTRERALSRSDVDAAAPYVEGQGMAFANGAIAGVTVRGIDPELEHSVSSIEQFIAEGDLGQLSADGYDVAIGTRLASQLDVGVDDELTLYLAQANITPFGAIPRQRAFRVIAIFDSGIFEYDRGMVLTHFAAAARLFRTGNKATGLQLKVTDIYAASDTAAAFARQLGGGYYVSDWSRRHAAFFRSIQISKAILAVVLSLIICVAAFNIVSTLVMIVREKRGDIAILRSFGATSRAVLQVFAVQGTLIGAIGVAAGVAVGVAVANEVGRIVAWLESLLGMELFSGEAYPVTELPSRVEPAEVMQIAVAVLIIGLIATIFPAISAARQQPADALRNE